MSAVNYLIIGIDPDIHKSGIALYWKEKGKRHLTLENWKFFELYDFLYNNQEIIKYGVVEAGYLNSKSNFRDSKANARASSRIGKNVGSNHECARKIIEMFEYLEIPVYPVKPLKLVWGKDGKSKISHKEFVKFTGIEFKSTNSEQRDAGLLVWGR